MFSVICSQKHSWLIQAIVSNLSVLPLCDSFAKVFFCNIYRIIIYRIFILTMLITLLQGHNLLTLNVKLQRKCINYFFTNSSISLTAKWCWCAQIRTANLHFDLSWLKCSLFSLVHSRSNPYQSFGLNSIIWIAQPLYMWCLVSQHSSPEGGWLMWCSDNGLKESFGSYGLWANVPCPLVMFLFLASVAGFGGCWDPRSYSSCCVQCLVVLTSWDPGVSAVPSI